MPLPASQCRIKRVMSIMYLWCNPFVCLNMQCDTSFSLNKSFDGFIFAQVKKLLR